MTDRFYLLFAFILINFCGNAQRLERMLLEAWSTDSWVNVMEQTHTYDKAHVSATTIKHWNDRLTAWVNHSKTTLQRDLDGKVIRKEMETWDANTLEWTPSQSTVNTFDAAGNPIGVETSVFKNGDWKLSQKELSAYDSEGRLISKITQSWQEQFGDWTNSRQYLYEFTDDRMSAYRIDYWNVWSDAWENYKKVEFTASLENQTESRKDYSWINEEWVLSTLQVYEHDEANNVTAINIENFNEKDGIVRENRVEYYLNEYKKLSGSLSKVMVDGQLTNLQRCTYTYSQEADIAEYPGFDVNQMEAFPNPTTRLINLNSLKSGNITIIDQTGRVVWSTENRTEESLTIDVSTWEAGSYTIQTSDGETHKFIKK